MDGSLPVGLLANTAVILGITLGKMMPEVVGEDVADRDGREHPGIIAFPVPVLRGTREQLQEIREKLYREEFWDETAVDFTDLAQGCKCYGEYIEKMKGVSGKELRFFGLGICGDKKKVSRLTGNLPLLRADDTEPAK